MKQLSSARNAVTVVAVLGWIVVAIGLVSLAYGLFAVQTVEWIVLSIAVSIAGYLQVAASEIGFAIVLTAESTMDTAYTLRHSAGTGDKRQS